MDQQLRVSVDNLLEGMQVIGQDWRYLYVNKAAAGHGQRPAEELVGRTMMECYPGIENTDVFRALSRVMETRRSESLQSEFVLPSGDHRWFDLFIDPVPDGICVMSLDVTDRRRAEESSARLAALVTSSDDAIIGTALDGTVLTWNGGAERLYGFGAGEIVGQSNRLYMSPDQHAHVMQLHGRLASGEHVPPFEAQRVRRDGSLVEISVTLSPIHDASGQVAGVSSIARDITERKRAEAEVQRLNREMLEQRLRVFRATMTTVHDIVNNLLNNLQLIRLEGEGRLSEETLMLFDSMIEEGSAKLKRLAEVETVNERAMAIGMGIEYPGSDQ